MRLPIWMRRSFLLLLLALAAPALADVAPLERIEVRVTTISGAGIYLDKGRDAKIEPGDPVRLFPPGRPAVTGVVRSVSRNSARVELRGAASGVTVGAPGEVMVPEERLRPAPTTEVAPESAVPQDPASAAEEPSAAIEWESPPESWDEAAPLLAPVTEIEAEDREPRLHGRAFTGIQYTDDNESGNREYLSTRSGIDFEYENPFHRGGVLDVDLEYSYRQARVSDGDDDTDSTFRPGRLSYHWGGRRDEPNRWEVGRFLQHGFPELGVVDGFEFGRRLESGDRVGTSVGFRPDYDDEMKTSDDVQTAAYYRYVSDDDETLTLGLAYQKTWHEGEADRDLLVASGDVHPTKNVSLYSTAWVDYYTSDDDIKSEGFELTELHVNGDVRLDGGHGVGVFYTDVRWPELLSDDFLDISDDRIDDNHVQRYGARAWSRLSNTFRLSGHLGRWEDQDDTGGDWDLSLGVRDLLYDRGEISLSVFDTEGSFSSGFGFRVAARRALDRGFVALSWDRAEYDQDDFSGDQGELVQHALRATYDTGLSDSLDLTLFAEKRFGDEQDSVSGGFSLQHRF